MSKPGMTQNIIISMQNSPPQYSSGIIAMRRTVSSNGSFGVLSSTSSEAIESKQEVVARRFMTMSGRRKYVTIAIIEQIRLILRILSTLVQFFVQTLEQPLPINIRMAIGIITRGMIMSYSCLSQRTLACPASSSGMIAPYLTHWKSVSQTAGDTYVDITSTNLCNLLPTPLSASYCCILEVMNRSWNAIVSILIIPMTSTLLSLNDLTNIFIAMQTTNMKAMADKSLESCVQNGSCSEHSQQLKVF